MVAASKKDVPLEALRGLAAISVILGHSIGGFFPQSLAIFPNSWPINETLEARIWFGLVNGAAAVVLFFVLSGFVLTRRFLLTGDQRIIVRGALKRWPRLAGPVLVTVLTSWFLFKIGGYHFAEGGAATGSPWLARFAYAFVTPFAPRFWGAVGEGVYATFFTGEYLYDSSLWTMKIEFIGSFVAFGLALLIAQFPKERKLLSFAMIALVFLLCYLASPFYAAFPVGVALAVFLPESPARLPHWMVCGMILAAIYLFGYADMNVGAFTFTTRIFGTDVITAHIVGSVLAIVAIELAPEQFRRWLSGRISELLGKLSFPLYLIHVLVLCSLGCGALLWARTWASGYYPNIIAGAVTLIGSLLAAVPLAIFNERWVGWVNTATNRLLSRHQPQNRAHPDGLVVPADVTAPN